MEKTADVVIIGGGIAGVSTSYFLAKAGVKSLLVEMDRLGSGTTGYTAAFVALQENDPVLTTLSQISYPHFKNFRDEFGVDINFHQEGSLSIDISSNSESLRKRAAFQISRGIETEILDRTQIQSIAPFLNTNDTEIGLFSPEGSTVDANALMQSYAKFSRQFGSKLYETVKATNIEVEKESIVGVHTTEGYISTRKVINAAGIFSKIVGEWVNVKVPTMNKLRHTILIEPFDQVPETMPVLEVLNPLEMYIGVRGKSIDISIGSLDIDNYVHAPQLARLLEINGDDLIYRIPQVEKLNIIDTVAGIRSLTLDDLPVIEALDYPSGFINNCGWGGNGISLCPIGGIVTSALVMGNPLDIIDTQMFSSKRFNLTD